MTSPSAPLKRVKRAASKREGAEREYRSALLAAVDADASYAAIAAAADVTRQTVRVAVLRARASN
jgi:DNA-directed RNA polymerase specialized sigma24 family protein